VTVFLYHKKHMKMKGEPNILLTKLIQLLLFEFILYTLLQFTEVNINSNASLSLLETCTTISVAIQTILLTS